MKTYSELMAIPGIKGIREHRMTFGRLSGGALAWNTLDIFCWPDRFLPHLRENAQKNPCMRKIVKVDIKAPLEVEVLAFGRLA